MTLYGESGTPVHEFYVRDEKPYIRTFDPIKGKFGPAYVLSSVDRAVSIDPNGSGVGVIRYRPDAKNTYRVGVQFSQGKLSLSLYQARSKPTTWISQDNGTLTISKENTSYTLKKGCFEKAAAPQVPRAYDHIIPSEHPRD